MIKSNDESRCPLCKSGKTDFFFEDKNRAYVRCSHCKLVVVPECYRLSTDDEKAIYDLHENDVGDKGYRRFLSRLSTPLLERLEPGKQGLDFGCGPGPTLSTMLEGAGHTVDLYDPIYYNDVSVFTKQYDFICATEVVEHLYNPDKEFTTLFSLLKPVGWLGIMTKMVIDKQAFSRWHYTHDLTHVCFYSRSTFEYLAERFNADLTFIGKDVILFRKR